MADEANLWEGQRHHYNSHVTDLSTQEAIRQRNEGPAQALKHFHNHVKRQLIMRFAHKQERLLDLCCGRGGDLNKWREANIKYVKGLDISEREVEEARRRYAEMGEKRRGVLPQCEFEAVDWLGARPFLDAAFGPGGYGVVTCMFALHYFFVTEASLRTFLANVAANLRQGGYFLGTIPSGHRVQELLAGKPHFHTPMLKLVRRWKDPQRPAPFGSGYICDIADTVTASLQGATEGSLEYLVDLPTLTRCAADAGLFPVCDFMDPVLAGCFEQEDIDAPYKRFKPFFLHSLQLDVQKHNPHPQPPSSLEKASSLFVAFVFQKTNGPESITLPIAPECTYMQPPRHREPQAWPGQDGGPMGHPGPGPGMGMPQQPYQQPYPHHMDHGGPMGHPGHHMGGPMGHPGRPGPPMGPYGGGGPPPYGGGYGEGPPHGHGPPGRGPQGEPPNKRPRGNGAYG